MYYNSSFLVTIINIKRRKFFFTTSHQKKMKVLTIYLLSLCLFASVGTQLANNIKESLQERTNRFESALSSYSIYLQGN